MGKLQGPGRPTARKSSKRPPGKAAQNAVLVIRRNPSPSPEQIARSQALGRFLEERHRNVAAMSPDEIAQAQRDWEKFKKTINEGRQRKVILD